MMRMYIREQQDGHGEPNIGEAQTEDRDRTFRKGTGENGFFGGSVKISFHSPEICYNERDPRREDHEQFFG